MNERADRPWWLWPNLMSLDAPAVAVVWQLFLAADAGVPVPPVATVVLGLVVWGVYLADRAFDAAGGDAGSDRHRFAARNRTAQVAISGIAFLVAGALALGFLPRIYLEVGAAVAFGTGAYLIAVHLGRRLLGAGAKELSVGVVFAAGVSVPLAVGGGPGREWLPGAVAFAGLCALNCLLIARWEEPRSSVPRRALVVAAWATFVAVVAPWAVATAVGTSAAALGTIHFGRAKISVRAARVLADVALLSPLVVAVIV